MVSVCHCVLPHTPTSIDRKFRENAGRLKPSHRPFLWDMLKIPKGVAGGASSGGRSLTAGSSQSCSVVAVGWPPLRCTPPPPTGEQLYAEGFIVSFFFKGEGAVTPEESNVRPQVSRPDGGKTGDLVQAAPCFLGDPRVTAPLGVALVDVREAHHTDHWQWAEAPKPHP